MMVHETRNPGFVRTLLTSSAVFVLSRGAGFLVPLVLALSYGASQFMDDFFLALAFQSFVGTTLGSIAEVVVVPALARGQGREAKEGPFLRSILRWGFFVALSFVGLLSLPAVLFFSGTAMEAYWSLAFYPPLAVCTGILLGAFNAREHYNWTAGVPGGRAVIIVLGILLLPVGSYWVLSGVITGAECILLVCLAVKAAYHGMLQGRGGNVGTWDALKKAFILSLGTLLLGLNPLVDKTFASFLNTGSISLMEYSFVLFYIPANLLHGPLLTILLTRWVKDKNLERIAAESKTVALWIASISLGVIAVYVLVGHPVLNIGLGSKLTAGDLTILWIGGGILMAGLAPYVIGGMYSRVLLVKGKVRTISVLAFVNALLNLVLNTLFVNFLGLYGILLSTTVTFYVLAALLGWFAFRESRYSD